MAEYYAVERSPEYLMHYGIKGMKWGVRKAIESGNSRALERQYAKASKKLAKLNKNADVGEQRKQQLKYAKRAGIGIGLGSLGTGGIFGSKALKYAAGLKYNTAISDLMDKAYAHGRPGDAKGVENFVVNNPIAQKHLATYQKRATALDKAKLASAMVGVGGIAYGGYAGARSLISKHRQTKKGHAKAIAKRNAFEREMNKAFKGTRYDNHKKDRR